MTANRLPAPTAAAGPILAVIDCPTGFVNIIVDQNIAAPEVAVHTDDTSGPAADAVRNTKISQQGNRVTVTVPDVPGSGGITQTATTRGGRTTVTQTAGTVYGNITGMTIVNGRVTVGGASNVTPTSQIRVNITLPAGSGVQMRSYNAGLQVTGPLSALEFDTHNGDLYAGLLGRLKVRGHNGTNEIDAVQEWVDIETHNGTIYIGSYAGAAARLITHNGNVELAAAPSASGRIEARSHNGNIRLRGVSGRSDLDVVTKTRNGHVSK